MIVRLAIALILLAVTACVPAVKGPAESGRAVYYDPASAIGSDGLAYPPRL